MAKLVFEWGPVRALASAYDLIKDVGSAVKEYNSFAATLLASQGLITTIKILKDLNGNVKLVAIGVEVDGKVLAGKWFSTYRSGIPRCLPHLNRLLKGGYYSRRMATVITSSVELLRTKPVMDTKPITD